MLKTRSANYHDELVRFDDLEDKLAILETLTPNRTEIYSIKAQYKKAQGLTDEAMAHLDEGLSISPNEPYLLWLKGSYYFEMEQTDKAATYLYQAIDNYIEAANEEIYLWLSEYYIEQNDFEKVARVYQLLLVAFPGENHYRANLAATYAQLGQYQKAKKEAEKLKKLDKSFENEVEQFLESIEPFLE